MRAPHRIFFLAGVALLSTAAVARSASAPSAADVPPPAAAEVEPRKLADYYSCTLYSENDVYTIGPGTDRYYTTGQKITVITDELANFEQEFESAWARFLARQATKKAERNTAVAPSRDSSAAAVAAPKSSQYRVTYSVGQSMFTPAHLQEAAPILDDRPYAGWLYFSVGLQARSRSEGFLERLSVWQLDTGVVGPWALAKPVQDFVHDNISHSLRAKGWAHQLRNEPGLNFVYQHKLRWFVGTRDGLGGDAIAHTGFSLGNVATYANLGLTLRAGFGLPDDFGADLIRPGADTSQAGGLPPRWGLHAFVGGELRGVARDIFLDGNTFRDSQNVTRESLVADFQYGISLNCDRWKLTLSQIVRSPEFKNQAGAQAYGSLTLTFPFPHLKNRAR